MSLSLTRKVEKAFVADYLPDALNITGLTIYAGHEKAAEKAAEIAAEIAFPALVVYAEGSSPHPEMPVETWVRNIRLRCKFLIDSDANDSDDRDDWKGSLEMVMIDDIEAIQAILNKPAGTDNRTVKGIHFHFVEMSDDPSEVNETDWEEDMVFIITAEMLAEE